MARFWANGPTQASDDEIDAIRAEMHTFGASEEQIQTEIAELTQETQVFELLEENKTVWLWFTEVDDLFKWNKGVCLGLDVTAVHADAQMSDREYTKLDFKGLRMMGREAAAELNKGRK